MLYRKGQTGLQAYFQRPYPVLAILFLIYMCNTMDRNIVAFLAEPIRKDLDLNDTELGLLTGLAFAFFYTIFGVPVGWIADRMGRVLTISVACVVWSVCSMAGALSASFAHLAIARIGVAIGEAGGTAPSYALIAAKFPPQRRGAALGLFHVASPVSAFIGVALSAWVASYFGWRAGLIAVSLPGLIAALALFLLVREPAPEISFDSAEAPALLASFRGFLRHPVLRLCFLFAGLTSCTSHALISWLPSFMMRVKGMNLLDISIWYSVCFSVSFGLGLWLGGVMADGLGRRTPLAYAFVPAGSLLIAIPFMIMAIVADRWSVSLLLWTVPLCMAGTFLAPAIAIVQAYAPPRQVTLFGSIYLLANNLVGAGLGPLYVGVVSDAFKSTHGAGALGLGLLALIPVILLAITGQLLIARAINRNRTAGFASND
ncbi:MFS transporter [Sphingobium sp.]|uniref:spinster family MFS transporter n=1 Tax=Sphingobium sp. TaxID=1912891 RepID=UPI002BDA4B13|nr:MFS transporter [Sphingobium sp.]HUD94000.1 MFS transporter [Sphingobium sp.]